MAKSMRTNLGQVRGLGSAHHGIHHWWMQRLTAIALVPLSIWFVLLVLRITQFEGDAFVYAQSILAHPIEAVLSGIFVIALFHHLQLGLQVVIEDYVHGTAAKFTSIILIKLACFLVAASCLFSILKIAL